jgi:hypothetical protein
MKIFVISYQRTGTTSTGKFFKSCGYKVAGWDVGLSNRWTEKWFEGNYKSIIESNNFKNYDVFEDDPWWCKDFYKYLFFTIKDSQFVLVERNSDKWYDSMLSRGKGKTLGSTYIHSNLYNREHEYNSLNSYKSKDSINDFDKLLPLNETHREDYKKIYESRNTEVKRFFERNGKDRLINVQLEDPNKWEKIANHFNIINFPKETWVNKSKN